MLTLQHYHNTDTLPQTESGRCQLFAFIMYQAGSSSASGDGFGVATVKGEQETQRHWTMCFFCVFWYKLKRSWSKADVLENNWEMLV